MIYLLIVASIAISIIIALIVSQYLLSRRIKTEFGGRVKMAAMIRSLTDGVALFDNDKKVIITNAAMSKMTGLPREGFYISELTALFRSKVDAQKKLDEALSAKRTTYINEAVLVNFTYEIYIEPLLSEKGDVLGGAVIIRDITAFKDLEVAKQLIEQEKLKSEILLEAIGDGVIAINREWNIVAWNKAASAISGYSKEEVIGRPFREVVKFIRRHNRTENISFIEDAMVKGEIRMMEDHTVIITKSGKEIPVGDSAAPVLSGGSIVGAIIIFRDISKEEETQSLRSDFAYASHQLRTPVAQAAWNIEIALEAKDKEEARKYLEIAADSMKSVVKLAEHLVEVSAIDQGRKFAEMRGIRLSDVFESALRNAGKKAESLGVKITVAPIPALIEITTDAKLLERILFEILDNAVIYSPEKSEVFISTNVTGEGLLVEIRDSGIGIRPEEQPLVFTKFFRGGNFDKNKIPGAGLGLFIAGEYVGLLGGKIWFNSETDKGTTFFVRIPTNGG